MHMPLTDQPSGAPNGADGAANAPLTNPFAAGPGGFLVSADDAESRPSPLGSALVLLAVLATAAGVLFGMRQMGMGPKLALADIQIDYPIDAQSIVAAKDHERILDDLKTGGNLRRVPLEMVQTNPFAWRSLVQKETPGAKPIDEAELTRRQAEERRQMLADASARLSLQSIMGGGTPMARIGGELVRVGDRVGEHFTVSAITGRAVELVAGDQTFTLTMSEKSDTKHAPARKPSPRR